MNRPPILILDFKEALAAFLYVAEDKNLPTLDVDSVIDRIFNCLISNDVAINQLAYYANKMLREGLIIENLNDLTEGQFDVIEQAIYDLGIGCYTILRELKAYDQDGRFMYRYKGTLDDSSIVFEEITSI